MKKFIVFISVCALYSCGDPNTSLLSQLQITYMVNPNVGPLIKRENLYAKQIDETNIVGTGNGYLFKSNDFFRSFQASEQQDPKVNDLSRVAFIDRNAIVTYSNPDDYTIPMHISLTSIEDGNSKKTLIDKNSILKDIAYSFQYTEIQFVDTQKGWLLVKEYSYDNPTNTIIYSVEIGNPEAQKLAKIIGYTPIDMHFIDKNIGYMILGTTTGNYPVSKISKTCFSKTTDGGSTWSTPVVLYNEEKSLKLKIIEKGKVITFGFDGISYSIDDGVTWVTSEGINAHSIADISFVNSSTGYAITNNGSLYKTYNSGMHWSFSGQINPVLAGEFNGVDFYNENIGLALGRNYLFSTIDGGKSWKPIIYPFEYVID